MAIMGHSLCARNPPTRSDKRKNIGAIGEIVSDIYSRQTGKARHMLPCGSVEETRPGQRTMGVRFRRASKKHHGRRLPSGREDNESSSKATRKPDITFTTAINGQRQARPTGGRLETNSPQGADTVKSSNDRSGNRETRPMGSIFKRKSRQRANPSESCSVAKPDSRAYGSGGRKTPEKRENRRTAVEFEKRNNAPLRRTRGRETRGQR
jgi:hypothetical protein